MHSGVVVRWQRDETKITQKISRHLPVLCDQGRFRPEIFNSMVGDLSKAALSTHNQQKKYKYLNKLVQYSISQ